jgi:hypothetical protein
MDPLIEIQSEIQVISDEKPWLNRIERERNRRKAVVEPPKIDPFINKSSVECLITTQKNASTH